MVTYLDFERLTNYIVQCRNNLKRKRRFYYYLGMVDTSLKITKATILVAFGGIVPCLFAAPPPFG